VATGAHAVDWLARDTGTLRAKVFRTARQLQMADPDLWPKARKGGGRGAAHLEERHLVSLALALAVADPITAAPASVRRFRALMPSGSVLGGAGSHLARTLHGHGAFVAGASLGVSLERLVDLLAEPDETLRELLPQAAFAVRFVKDERFPRAEVRFGDVVVQYGAPKQDAPISQEAEVAYSVFITLGDLLQTTRAYRIQKPFGEIFRRIHRRPRRKSSSQTAAFRPDENTAVSSWRSPTVFPNQPHAERAQLGRRTPESLVRVSACAQAVPAAGPPPIFLKEIDHGPPPAPPGAA
jgi:hypothetical protein